MYPAADSDTCQYISCKYSDTSYNRSSFGHICLMKVCSYRMFEVVILMICRNWPDVRGFHA